ncbi:uncharacterized protein LOC109716565 [Ananas comosus]|uniref:tRNA(Ile)-lysidine synthetase n=1 Tax=Ananas comosus TaxID=4615 RepID=A0A6P5FNU4_ANACO|nr:uncharacterized protein LOC109716565 [Ananas comosus]XP_020097679.1 uncharacterized protein LOC109716565 [Ananas comosus]
MLLSFRVSPYLPLRRFFFFLCRSSSSSAPPPLPMAGYKEAFARRMAMAGIKPHHRIALGVSGGPDSMALCVLAAGWKLDGSAPKDEASGYIEGLLGIVVDHRLRPESTEEAEIVRDRVNNMGIRCEIACCSWPDGQPKQGHLQEAAREMRYRNFQRVCEQQQIGILLIAHHADDQAELLILRLSRGSGVLGLAGMAFISQLFPTHLRCSSESPSSNGILLVRPMLEFSKEDMYKICQGVEQVWVEDPTNQNLSFVRNRIRASLTNLSSCAFRLELQSLISACRLTRAYVDSFCHKMMRHSVTIDEHGYAIIDLEKLEPTEVDDLCLSQYLASILQFISQRHRPIRGRTARLLISYFRKIPCKTSLSAAGCYLCAAPRSKGSKILICCLVESPQSFIVDFSSTYSCREEQCTLPSEIAQIIKEAALYSNESAAEVLNISFLNAKCSMDVLSEAKKLDIISESTLKSISLLSVEEHEKFITTTEAQDNQESMHEMNFSGASSITIRRGEACHFMNRFLITWNSAEDAIKSDRDQDHLCEFCLGDRETILHVRHLVDADWLFLAEVCRIRAVGECQCNSDVFTCKPNENEMEKPKYSTYMQLSAAKALQALKSIPVSARRALPALVNSQGLLLGVPSIGFRCCPCLSVATVFSPRVPLGGGFTLYT